MSACVRRLPIYLLLDCSESMAGEAIEDVSRGVDMMIQALHDDPLAIETAYVSVITFSREAKQAVPLTEVLQFQRPKLSVRTGTALGAALHLLQQCLRRDVVKTTDTTKGDYKPIVILLTDGQPTDEWESAADQIKQQRKPGIANIYAVACGPDGDTDVLRRVTDIVLQMKEMSRESFRKLFVWLTASVQTTSKALEGGGEGAALNLPALPQGIEMAPASAGYHDPRPRQVFLHALCSKTGRPYLMRFARRPGGEHYVALCSHPLEEIEKDPAGTGQTISTAHLDGCPSCPYCENPAAAKCECGALFCVSSGMGVSVCPSCHMQVMASPASAGGFDISQAEG